MSKALRAYPENMRAKVAAHRVAQGISTNVKGNGFLGAMDYIVGKKLTVPKAAPKKEEEDAEVQD